MCCTLMKILHHAGGRIFPDALFGQAEVAQRKGVRAVPHRPLCKPQLHRRARLCCEGCAQLFVDPLHRAHGVPLESIELHVDGRPSGPSCARLHAAAQCFCGQRL
eukprot:scaffold27814_cov77-Phaeocystis_antarctica.AAC.2